ncbi:MULTISPECIES: isochorismatase family protein [unclassified Methylobacterium]|jgi:nicotinamidase-related amidase|uniref:isochorismatase family protein n=1 Tax=unclassified Methylobacterium TaxID=2615210 RepID=UPI001353DD64|nr:isochorismatase family protein [Methylobacterium sp. 2A]MWV24285.1 isochorismatase family protein [Methylobacterium sp. 2A]
MPLIDPARSLLLVIDVQVRLMPAIAGGADVIANTGRLTTAARLLDVPVLVTEQNAGGLGPTVPELAPEPGAAFPKMSFGATRAPGFLDRLPDGRDCVVAGCEAHICVLQTVLGLLEAGRRVTVVADAVGSRKIENRDAGLARMAAHGAEIVTTEMVVFEWLGTARHPRFREVVRLIK